MRSRTGFGRALAAALLFASSTASAVTPHAASLARDAEWATTAAAAVSEPIRLQADYDWDRPVQAVAWNRFTAIAPGTWYSSWDRATGVPSRIFGQGIVVTGASASADVAAAFARAFLAEHLDLLAPGAATGDFELVSNVSDGEIRSIGFFQRAHGMRVVGGQIGFEFKRDRLFVIHSEALPDVQIATTITRMAALPIAALARASTIAELGLTSAQVGTPGEPVVLPLVGADRVLGYRVVVPVDVDAGADGRWTVYADAGTGAPIARYSELHFGTGTVQYDAVVRWSGRPRALYPAQLMHAQINGSAETSAETGAVTWSGVAPATVTATTEGDLVKAVNTTGPSQTFMTSVADTATTQWSLASDASLDAEINVFVHVQIAKAYVRTFAPDLQYLDDQTVANVDLPMTCNAYYTNGTVNFFKEGNGCGNTGTIADVIYHEYEHGVHEHSIIDGLGAFEGSLSEGQSDFLAISITGDSGMGRGFHEDDQPLREIDPPDGEARWPENVGEIHTTGIIFSGAMWDLRKALIAQLGEPAGVQLVNKLFYAAIQRSPTIPATLVEVLAADDDNGNLADGTPHECAILTAFGAHGLRPWTATVTQPGLIVAGDAQTTTTITANLTGLSARCTSDAITSIKLAWTPRSGGSKSGNLDMTPSADPTQYMAELPLPADGNVVGYQVRIKFADGSSLTLPDSLTDPYYALYQGETVPLLCTDFETDPLTQGWTHQSVTGHDDWSWGTPIATTSGDPGAAVSGTHVIGTTLGSDGRYSSNADMLLDAPPIDLGKYSDVHLQYRRYLSVQDGQFDQATIFANGEAAWQNLATAQNRGEQLHHIDKEWRFDDVPLSGHIADGHILNLAFELTSDGAYQLGGWNIDDVCVVANAHATCGDGIKQGTEQCDTGDANADLPDVCRTYCRLPTCGDGILDTGEACDDGNKATGDTCTPTCTIPPPPPDTGCCEAGRSPGAGIVLVWMMVGALLLRRRRRRAA